MADRSITQALVRPDGVVVIDVFINQISKVVLAEDHEVIEAFLFDRLDPSLYVRVEVRRRRGDWLRRYPRFFEDRIEYVHIFNFQVHILHVCLIPIAFPLRQR